MTKEEFEAAYIKHRADLVRFAYNFYPEDPELAVDRAFERMCKEYEEYQFPQGSPQAFFRYRVKQSCKELIRLKMNGNEAQVMVPDTTEPKEDAYTGETAPVNEGYDQSEAGTQRSPKRNYVEDRQIAKIDVKRAMGRAGAGAEWYVSNNEAREAAEALFRKPENKCA